MPIIEQKQRGATWTSGDVSAIVEAIRLANSLRSGRGLMTLPTPGGPPQIALTPSGETVAGAVQAQLTSSATAPAYGVVEYYLSLEARYGETILQCRRPSLSGFSRIGVTLAGAAQNDAVWIAVAPGQVVPVLYDTTYGTVSAGDRLGCRKDSYYAQKDTLGPFSVLAVQGEYTSPIYVAIVEITGRRGDHKICTGTDADGPYQTIAWGSDYTITESSKGIISVSLA